MLEPFPPIKPEEFIEDLNPIKELYIDTNGGTINYDDIPFKSKIELNLEQHHDDPDEILVRFYNVGKIKNPHYDEMFKKYEKQLERYNKDLDKYNTWKTAKDKKDAKRAKENRLKMYKKLKKEFGE